MGMLRLDHRVGLCHLRQHTHTSRKCRISMGAFTFYCNINNILLPEKGIREPNAAQSPQMSLFRQVPLCLQDRPGCSGEKFKRSGGRQTNMSEDKYGRRIKGPDWVNRLRSFSLLVSSGSSSAPHPHVKANYSPSGLCGTPEAGARQPLGNDTLSWCQIQCSESSSSVCFSL